MFIFASFLGMSEPPRQNKQTAGVVFTALHFPPNL